MSRMGQHVQQEQELADLGAWTDRPTESKEKLFTPPPAQREESEDRADQLLEQ